jgi:hypothetical protein
MNTERPDPFSVADVRPHAGPAKLDELQGPDHGVVALPSEVAWSGRREFDLDDEYDRAAMYKIVLEEGQEADQRRLLNWRILRRDWRSLFPARSRRRTRLRPWGAGMRSNFMEWPRAALNTLTCLPGAWRAGLVEAVRGKGRYVRG